MLDFKNFNEDSMNHLRITQCFVNYFVSLGLIVENIRTNDNEIIIYTSTPKDTICEKAFREKEHDLCGMFLAQKFKSVISGSMDGKNISVKNKIRDEVWDNISYETTLKMLKENSKFSGLDKFLGLI